MAPETWRDQEPGFAKVAEQTFLLLRRGFRRRVLTFGSALLTAITCVVVLIRLPPSHAPRVVIRVTEMDRDPVAMPRLKRQLADYMREAVFTSDALLSIIQRYGLYGSLAKKNPRAAIDGFREDIELNVYQNYFIEERIDKKPRTARIAVSFRSRDRERAVAVTRELGNLVIERERRNRREQAVRALANASLSLERAARAFSDRRNQIVAKRLEIEESGQADPIREVELVSLLGSLEQRQRELDQARTSKTSLEVALALERAGVGMSFEIADEGAIPRSAELSRSELAGLGAGVFIGVLPLAALLVGAFVSKRGAA